jgi:hypothetical protein
VQRSPASGTVTGLLTLGPDFRYDLQLNDAGEIVEAPKAYGLAQVAYQDPGGGWPVGNTEIERAAMDWIATQLGRDKPQDGWCTQSGDLRAGYCANKGFDAGDIPAYPGDGKGFCKPEWGSCQDEWTRVVEQLKVEWEALTDVRLLFADLQNVLTIAHNASDGTPQAISDHIVAAMRRQAAGRAEGSVAEALTFVLEAAGEVLPLGGFKSIGELAAVSAVAMSSLDPLTRTTGDDPAFDLRIRGDQLAMELNSSYLTGLAQLGRLHSLIVSDWDKLRTVAHTWSSSDENVASAAGLRAIGISRWLWQEIVPSAYGITTLTPPPSGKRINDLWCSATDRGAYGFNPFGLENDAASWLPIDHFDGAMNGQYSVVQAMGAGDFHQSTFQTPPGDMVAQMFQWPASRQNLDVTRPGLERAWFFRRADWVSRTDGQSPGKDMAGQPKPPPHCNYGF